MFEVLGVRMVERAIICLTNTTAPVQQTIMAGIAKVSSSANNNTTLLGAVSHYRCPEPPQLY